MYMYIYIYICIYIYTYAAYTHDSDDATEIIECADILLRIWDSNNKSSHEVRGLTSYDTGMIL